MTKSDVNFSDRIVQDPEIMVGKPVIKGTRIPVALILEQLAGNPDLDELLAAYPRLTIEDVKAALSFAHDSVEHHARRNIRAARQGTSPAAV